MISVVICTHNPRESYLSRTLLALQSQTLSQDTWELVVVDNASTPALAGKVDLEWHRAARMVREETLGLTPARLAGIRASSGGTLVFVDDDNVLAADYLENVLVIATSREFLGAWSGNVNGEFEEMPPEWTRRYHGNLVIRDVPRDAWSNLYSLHETTPLGAGLCVRRRVALEYQRLHDSGARSRVLDRAGKSLVSGGDNDLAACALDLGMGWGLMSSLRLTHLIPRERLTEEYLLRLLESVAYSSVILQSFRPETRVAAMPRGLAGRAADMIRRTRMSARERRFHDAVRRGEARARAELA